MAEFKKKKDDLDKVMLKGNNWLEIINNKEGLKFNLSNKKLIWKGFSRGNRWCKNHV